MQNLMMASDELFRRGPDECFATFDDLHRYCVETKERSTERWHVPDEVSLEATDRGLELGLRERESFRLNNWSFSQLCGLAGISRHAYFRRRCILGQVEKRLRPIRRLRTRYHPPPAARVAKLVDAQDLKSWAERHVGSIPAPGTSALAHFPQTK